MSEPFVGEIRMFGGNFAPRGWAFCDGQLLAVSQNDALFSLYGTIYGGDGRTTFGLPDMRGRVPIHAGTGPGLTDRKLGAKLGVESATLSIAQLPSHTHEYHGTTADGTSPTAAGNVVAKRVGNPTYGETDPDVSFNDAAITSVGGSQSHHNVQPILCVNFIVALFGVYPSRN